MNGSTSGRASIARPQNDPSASQSSPNNSNSQAGANRRKTIFRPEKAASSSSSNSNSNSRKVALAGSSKSGSPPNNYNSSNSGRGSKSVSDAQAAASEHQNEIQFEYDYHYTNDDDVGRIDRQRLQHLNTWGPGHGLSMFHSLAAAGAHSSRKFSAGGSASRKIANSCKILCECGELAAAAVGVEDNVEYYSCAKHKCDFFSGRDGKNVMAAVLEFEPGVLVKYTQLPGGYSWVDGCGPAGAECFGRVVDCDIVQVDDGFDLSVLVPLESGCWVTVEQGGDAQFDSVWFPREFLTVVNSPAHHRLRPPASSAHNVVVMQQPSVSTIDGEVVAENVFPKLSIVRFQKLPSDCRWEDGSSPDQVGEGRVVRAYDDCVLVDVGKPVVIASDGDTNITTDCVVYFPAAALSLVETRPYHSALHSVTRASGAAFFASPPPNSIRELIVRFTNVYQAVGFLGSNFSQRKHNSMTVKDWRRRFKTASKPLEPGADIDAFISYRWMMNRWLLFCSLLVHFNYVAAVCISLICTVVLLFAAGLISGYGGVRLLPFGDFIGSFEVWYFSAPCRLVLFLVFLAVWGQAFSRQKLFLDQNCISQPVVDPELTMASLRHLPHILSRCRKLLCVVDAEYFNRLWCLYEVAVYMKVRDIGHLDFVYCWQCVLFLAIFSCEALIRVVAFIIGVWWSLDAYDQQNILKFDHSLTYVVNAIMVVQWLTIYWVGRFYFRTAQEIRKQSREFDVRRAACGVEEDKPVILDFIREQFTEPEQEKPSSLKEPEEDGVVAAADPLDVFNRAVRKLLKKHSFSRAAYVLPYGFVVVAYCMRWYGSGLIAPGTWTLDLLDWLFYAAPKAKDFRWVDFFSGSNAAKISFRWYAVLVVQTFNILVRWPLMFYVESLIVKLVCLLEEAFPKAVRWWTAWLPVVLLFALWENVETLAHQVASEAVGILVGAESVQAKPTDGSTPKDDLSFGVLQYVFQCFGTNCLTFDFTVYYTTGIQILGLLIFIGEGLIIFLIHQPSWFRKLRRSLWRKVSAHEAANNTVLLPAVSSSRMSISSNAAASAVRQRRADPSFDGSVSSSGDEATTSLLSKKRV